MSDDSYEVNVAVSQFAERGRAMPADQHTTQ
jgi:hypothetical protein